MSIETGLLKVKNVDFAMINKFSKDSLDATDNVLKLAKTRIVSGERVVDAWRPIEGAFRTLEKSLKDRQSFVSFDLETIFSFKWKCFDSERAIPEAFSRMVSVYKGSTVGIDLSKDENSEMVDFFINQAVFNVKRALFECKYYNLEDRAWREREDLKDRIQALKNPGATDNVSLSAIEKKPVSKAVLSEEDKRKLVLANKIINSLATAKVGIEKVEEFFENENKAYSASLQELLSDRNVVLDIAEKDPAILHCIADEMLNDERFQRDLGSRNITIPKNPPQRAQSIQSGDSAPRNSNSGKTEAVKKILEEVLSVAIDADSKEIIGNSHFSLLFDSKKEDETSKNLENLLRNKSFVLSIAKYKAEILNYVGIELLQDLEFQEALKKFGVTIKKGGESTETLSQKDVGLIEAVRKIIEEFKAKAPLKVWDSLVEAGEDSVFLSFWKNKKADRNALNDLKLFLSDDSYVLDIAQYVPEVLNYASQGLLNNSVFLEEAKERGIEVPNKGDSNSKRARTSALVSVAESSINDAIKKHTSFLDKVRGYLKDKSIDSLSQKKDSEGFIELVNSYLKANAEKYAIMIGVTNLLVEKYKKESVGFFYMMPLEGENEGDSIFNRILKDADCVGEYFNEIITNLYD